MWGVKANVKVPHKYLRFGSVCWLQRPNPGNANDKIEVYGMARSGRRVETWVDARDLKNYRAAWVVDERGSYYGGKRFVFGSKEQAEAYAETMNTIYGNQPPRAHVTQFMEKP